MYSIKSMEARKKKSYPKKHAWLHATYEKKIIMVNPSTTKNDTIGDGLHRLQKPKKQSPMSLATVYKSC